MAGKGSTPLSVLPRALVDVLPERWWALGNLHFFPGTSKTWHFCVMPGYAEHPVRTVVLFGTHVAWGRKPFNFAASEQHGASLARRQAEQDHRS